jgi:signal transduction histidine kinase
VGWQMKPGEIVSRLFFSLRFRLLSIVLLAVILAAGLSVYSVVSQRGLVRNEADEKVLYLARLMALDQERIIYESHQRLLALSHQPELLSRTHLVCDNLLSNQLSEYPQYQYLGILSSDGSSVCQVPSPWMNSDLIALANSSLNYYQKDTLSSDFLVDYMVETQSIFISVPLPAIAEQAQYFLVAILDLEWMTSITAEAFLPEDSMFIIVDGQGIVLAHSSLPDEQMSLIGRNVKENPLVSMMLDKRQGTAAISGLDMVEKKYGFTTLENQHLANVYHIGVGLQIEAVFQNINQSLYRELTGISLVLIVVLAAAWFGGDLFILKRVNSLLIASRKFAHGDLSARTNIPYGQGELSHLAHAFDTLGAALERREIERKLVEDEIKRHIRDLSALNTITATVSSSLNLLEILESIKRLLAEQFNLPGGAVFFYSEETQELLLETAWGVPSAVLSKFKRFSSSSFHYKSVIEKGKVFLEHDFIKVEPYASAGLSASRPYLQSYLCIPLIAKGQVQGVIDMFSREYELFQPEQLDLFTVMGQEIGVAIQNARFFEEVNAARERLQNLSQQLIVVQENERRHISRELHDEIGQAMTAVKVNLQTISRTAEVSHLIPHLEESIQIIDRTIQQIRNLSLDLRPSLLDDLGIVSALRWYLDRQAQRAGFDASFTALPQDMRFSPELETTCFRIVQEAITNVVRHAKAKSVRVEIIQNGSELDVIVTDDGVGFDLTAIQLRQPGDTTLGLLGMRERVELVGGRLEIISDASHGTQIKACLPNS